MAMCMSHSPSPYTLLQVVFISDAGTALRNTSNDPIFSAFSVFNVFSDTESAKFAPFPDP